MTATISTADGRTTLTLKYTAESAKMQALLKGAAQALYAQGQAWWTEEEPPPPFEQLTNAQKLGMINAFIKRTLIGIYRDLLVELAQAEAKATAEAQAAIEME